MPEVITHPTAQALALFGHGKLSEAQSATVAAHLETCADCRNAVAGLPPDSFLGKVRAAKPGGTVLPPGPAPVRPAASPSMAGRPAAPPAPPADVPPELANHPKFRIIRELGRGGMGVIYLAEHRVMEKPVALKVISPAVLDNPDALARFHAEVKAAGKLDHQNIARAYDADQAGNLHFLVMEFVEGVSLAQLLEQKGPLPVGGACHLISQAALGLQHAFEQGMVHRDVKPQNLMLTPKGLVKVLDFGLARVRDERKAAPRLTQLESFMGTPEYVAPEQAINARSADTRSDIYSLGCTLYALLAGRPPFVEDTATKLVLAHVEKEPLPLHEVRPDVPAELSAVVAKMLAKDPAQRFQTPVEVVRALAPFVKAGSKAGAPAAAQHSPAVGAAGTGTRMGGDTSRMKGLGTGASKLSAKAAPLAAEEGKGSPFEGLADAPAAAPAPKDAKKERRKAKPTPAAWWKRPAVLAGGAAAILALLLVGLWAGGVFKVKTKDGTIVLENLPAGSEVLVDGEKVTVTWGADGKKAEIRVKPGTRKIVASRDGIDVIGEEVEIEDGGRKVLAAHWKSPASAEAAPARADAASSIVGTWDGTFPDGDTWAFIISPDNIMIGDNSFRGRFDQTGRKVILIDENNNLAPGFGAKWEGEIDQTGKTMTLTNAQNGVVGSFVRRPQADPAPPVVGHWDGTFPNGRTWGFTFSPDHIDIGTNSFRGRFDQTGRKVIVIDENKNLAPGYGAKWEGEIDQTGKTMTLTNARNGVVVRCVRR
ncbi:MAG TPA: protein kinase [Gemmataceae bacterium]|nr:protein kinase [Gemmataceae bacterium]